MLPRLSCGLLDESKDSGRDISQSILKDAHLSVLKFVKMAAKRKVFLISLKPVQAVQNSTMLGL